MGKKSKNPRKGGGTGSSNGEVPSSRPSAVAMEDADSTLAYPSDGPSMEELECLQTTSASLQAKLNQLTAFAADNNRAAFVEQFVPLDLPSSDRASYLQDLTTAPEAEGQWTNLVAEIAAITSGRGVNKIEGDQQTRAVFFFGHPLLPGCDREVTFVCAVNPNTGRPEWRAEG